MTVDLIKINKAVIFIHTGNIQKLIYLNIACPFGHTSNFVSVTFVPLLHHKTITIYSASIRAGGITCSHKEVGSPSSVFIFFYGSLI